MNKAPKTFEEFLDKNNFRSSLALQAAWDNSEARYTAEIAELRAKVAELEKERDQAKSSLAWITEAYEHVGVVSEQADWPNGPGRIVTWRNARAERAESKLALLPADWFTDSSLETWFPITAEILKSAEAELAALREAKDWDGWVSVEKSMPDEGRTVIVAGGIARWYMEDGEVVWRTQTGADSGRRIQWVVTHWRFIPSLPKEESDAPCTTKS